MQNPGWFRRPMSLSVRGIRSSFTVYRGPMLFTLSLAHPQVGVVGYVECEKDHAR